MINEDNKVKKIRTSDGYKNIPWITSIKWKMVTSTAYIVWNASSFVYHFKKISSYFYEVLIT